MTNTNQKQWGLLGWWHRGEEDAIAVYRPRTPIVPIIVSSVIVLLSVFGISRGLPKLQTEAPALGVFLLLFVNLNFALMGRLATIFTTKGLVLRTYRDVRTVPFAYIEKVTVRSFPMVTPRGFAGTGTAVGLSLAGGEQVVWQIHMFPQKEEIISRLQGTGVTIVDERDRNEETVPPASDRNQRIARRIQPTARGRMIATAIVLLFAALAAAAKDWANAAKMTYGLALYDGYFLMLQQSAYHSHPPAPSKVGPVDFQCAKCREKISAAAEDRAKMVKCPLCGKRQFAPR